MQHARLFSFDIPWSLLKLMSTESVMLSDHLILCCPLLLLLSIFPGIRVFSSELALHIKWPKYWNFSFSNSSSNEYSGLISLRIDWFDFLVVQGTLQSLLQHHNLKAFLFLWYSAFFMVQLSYPYTTTGKAIALSIHTFVGKVIFLLLNILFRFIIVFLPRSKCLYISWLVSPSAAIWEPKKILSIIASTFSPSICHEVVGPMPWSWFFECWVSSQLFHTPFLPSSRGFLVPLHFQLLKQNPLHIRGCLYFWASLTVNSSKRVLHKVKSSIKCLIRKNEDLRHYKMHKYREGDNRVVAQTLLFLFCKWVHLYPFLGSTCVISYEMFLSDWLHFVW